MNLKFFFGQSLESLTEHFIEYLDRIITEKGDPFATIHIVIPGSSMQTWLQKKIAEKRGISVNFSFEFLENFLSGLVLDTFLSADTHKEELPCFLNHQSRHLDMQLLLTKALYLYGGKPGGLLATYIKSENTESNSSFTKIWQLTKRLSQFFREYEYQRPDMIESWNNGHLFLEKRQYSTIEHDQMNLYNQLFSESKERADTTDQTYTTLPRFTRNNTVSKTNINDQNVEVLVFATTGISRFHLELMQKLSSLYSFTFFQVQYLPCFLPGSSDPWLEAGSLVEDPAKQGSLLTSDEEHPLTREWFEMARETAWQLAHLIKESKLQYPVTILDKPDSTGDTLLRLLQSSLLNQGVTKKKQTAQDKSLQIFGAPGIWREIETVYQSILYNLHEDPSLLFSDIALLVPDMTKYGPVIQTVFERIGHLPFYLSVGGGSIQTLVGNALLSGITLLNSRFTRSDLFDFFFNPLFMQRHGFSREDVHIMLEWVEQLSIYHAIDPVQKEEISADKTAVYTWKSGIKRLRLGMIMEETDPQFFAENETTCFFPGPSSVINNRNIAVQFTTLMEKLFYYSQQVRNKNMKGSDWTRLLHSFMADFLSIEKAEGSEQSAFTHIQEAIGKLNLLDGNDIVGQVPVTSTLIQSFITSIIEESPTGKGRYSIRGITIASLSDVRSIPFRITYICGLNEGAFPGRADLSRLDLRNCDPRPGDYAAPKVNRTLFAETLLSCREKLYLSYLSRDLQKDEEKFPSSCIVQLRDFLETNLLLIPQHIKRATFIIPLLPFNNWSRSFFSPDKIEQYADCSDIFLSLLDNQRILTALLFKEEGKVPANSGNRVKSVNILLQKKEQLLSNSIGPLITSDSLTRQQIIPLYVLKKFLENPLEAKLAAFHGIKELSSDMEILKEHEPFSSDGLFAWKLHNHLWQTILETLSTDKAILPATELTDRLRSWYRHQKVQGLTPEAEFASVNLNLHLEAWSDLAEQTNQIQLDLLDLLKSGKRLFKTVQITDHGQQIEYIDSCSLLRIPSPHLECNTDNGTTTTLLHGESNWYLQYGDRLVALAVTRSSGEKRYRALLPPLLTYTAATGSGTLQSLFQQGCSGLSTVLISGGPGSGEPFLIEHSHFQFSNKESLEYLTSLVTDFQDPLCNEQLPLSILTRKGRTGFPFFENFDEYDTRLKEAVNTTLENRYVKTSYERLLSSLPNLIPANGWQIVSRRYRPLFKLITNSKEGINGII